MPFDSVRLAMRALARRDAVAMHAAYSDAALMRYWSSPPHETLDQTIAYVTPRRGGQDWRSWAITVKGDDRAIGTLAATVHRTGVSEIGYLLVRSAWGQGYAREAVTTLIARLFDEDNRRIYADVDPDNRASLALLESIGFRREGLLRAEWETHIGVRDSVILGLLRDEWARPAGLPSVREGRLAAKARAKTQRQMLT